jgi:putative ABC transport system substrate-binding protein
MKRRTILQLAGLMLALPGWVLAQTPKRFRVGCLWVGSEANAKPFVQAFLAGLRDRGHVVGQNLDVDMRYADGDPGRFPALADELIALKPDVLVGLEHSARAMKAKTSTIPIVLPGSADPVAAGLVKSLARPGTNITGLAYLSDQLIAKHVELLTELVPKMSRVALLNDASVYAELRERYELAARTAATAKGLTLVVVEARDSQSLREAFATLEKDRPDGIVVPTTPVLFNLRREIIDGARRLRLSAITGLPAIAEGGLLLSYGANFLESYRYAASYVDRILKGAKPAELPVEQISKFELVLNMKTAREIDLAIPQSILLRADRVIE